MTSATSLVCPKAFWESAAVVVVVVVVVVIVLFVLVLVLIVVVLVVPYKTTKYSHIHAMRW